VAKEKKSRNRSFRRTGSDKSAGGQGDTLSPTTTGSSHGKRRGARRISSRSSDDDDDYEDGEEEDDVEEDEGPTRGVAKEKKSRNRSFRRTGSDKSAGGQGDTLSPTTGSSHGRGKGAKRSSSKSNRRVSDSEFSPLPPMGRASSRSLKKSESVSSDGGDDIEGYPSPPLPPALPPLAKTKGRKQDQGSGRRMSRRGSAPTGTDFDNLPESVASRRDSMAKHNSLRNFDVAQAKKVAGLGESLPVGEANLNGSDASMDGLSVMTEKRSNKTQEQRAAGPIITPSVANNPAQVLWK